MNPYQSAAALLHELHNECQGMKTGAYPSIHVLHDIYGRLVKAYQDIGDNLNKSFSAKERSYLSRKIAEAKNYKKGRMEKMTCKDAEIEALDMTANKYEQQIIDMENYEKHRHLLRSIDRAIEFCRSIRSYLNTAEKNG